MSIDPRVLTATLKEAQNAIPSELQQGPTPVAGNQNQLDDRFFGDGLSFRNDIIRAFEAEFGTFITPDTVWDQKSFFLVHGDSMFYYKPRLESDIAADHALITADQSSADFQRHFKQLLEIDPTYQIHRIASMSDIKTAITSNSGGLPMFISETPNFYQFKNIAKTIINLDDLTKDLMIKINSTFTGPYIPSSFDSLAYFLYEDEGQTYWTNLLIAVNDQTNKKYNLGIFWENDSPTEKYPNADKMLYYFPYKNSNKWSDQQIQMINVIGNYEAQVRNKMFQIIDL